MHDHYASARKIGPAARRPDGTPDDNDRVEIGPTALAFAEWAAAGLDAPDLARMRRWRLDRLVASLHARDLGGVLFYDPLNIRYASDTTNMQLWATHNPFRACLVTADGYMVIWDYARCGHMVSYAPLVRESRFGASFFYFAASDEAEEKARAFAGQIDELMRAHAGANRRLAVDKILPHGLHALEALGLEIHDGEEVAEKTRAIKGPDEIAAMRCAMHACERSMKAMEDAVAPGMTEVDAWAILQAENFRRGGEWIETRILASGPRTNPWFQECGPRVMAAGDLLAFDTDMIGCYGMCADISRTWLVGDGRPTAEQRRLYREAHAQIVENTAALRPGMTFAEASRAGRPLPEEFVARRYGSKYHGVGLCDEWPSIKYPIDLPKRGQDYVLEPGMTICVEAYVGADGGREGVKLEDQVLITGDGVENLTRYPFDARLLS